MFISDTFYGHADVPGSIERRLHALQTSKKLYESPVPGVHVVEARTGAGIFDELCFCFIVENDRAGDKGLLHGGLPIGMVILTPPPLFKNVETIRPPSYVKSPHCGIVRSHAGRGIVSSMYAHLLREGYFFVSCGRQTPAAELMWIKLGREFELNCVDRRYGVPIGHKVPGQWLYTLHDPLRFTVKSLLQPDFSTTRNVGFL